ncbi:hypothetical protein PAMA_003533 [Pampus argenteus]
MVLTVHLLTLIFSWTGISAIIIPSCDEDVFFSNVHVCLSNFNHSMETSSYGDGCPWPTVKRIYYDLKYCVDDWLTTSWCRGHRFLVDEVFLEVHNKYFFLCGQVQDPPLTTLIMLITPGIIFTLFVPLLCLKLTPSHTEMPSTLGL